MLTGELRSKIDGVWNAFWAGGIANPLEVIEQITYLLFMRGLDDLHTLEENKANRLKKPIERRIFPTGKDKIGKGGGLAYEEMRWSKLKNKDPATMFEIVSEHVFPFLRNMAEADTAHATHMKGARFTIPTPTLLAKVVDLLADMMAPGPKDVICDPACGTCGFLVAAGEYLRGNHSKLFQEKASRDHFHEEMFHGFDFDGTMLRIGSMNMTLHGVDNPDIRYKDSLAQEHAGDSDRYSLVLANPPFAGSLDYETTAKDLLAIVKTKKTELLFMALFLKLLKPGGRAAVIVPDGVLFGSSTAHKEIRRMLVEDHRLDGIVKLPSGVFRPYAGVSTAIVLFTKTNSGGTDQVWFYDCQADGFSLDDKRTALLPMEKIGPRAKLGDDEHGKNNLADIAARWTQRAGAERKRPRNAQSFCVLKAEIAATGYDLSINRYKEVVHETSEHRPPKEIIAELKLLEKEIEEGLGELEGMLA